MPEETPQTPLSPAPPATAGATADKRFNRDPASEVETKPQAAVAEPVQIDPVDRLFHEHFDDTTLGLDTRLWNAAVGFREAVKKLPPRS